jgi:endonuclease/exonuclease/phosphatase family metal-dependent hydrolase
VRAALLVLVAGCYGVDAIEADWEPVETITGVLAPEIGSSPAARAAPADNILRVATWNTFRAADPELLAREYQDSPVLSKADVLMIQEVEAHTSEANSRARRLADALGMTFVFAPARQEGYLHGVMIASRYPITNARVMRLPLGTAPFHQNARNALAAEIDLGTQTITLVDMHLDVRIGPVDRIRQMHPAVTQVPEHVIVGGDFNTNPWAWVGSTAPLTSTEAIIGQDQARVIDDYMTGIGFVSPISPDAVTFNRPLLDHMRLDNVYVRGYRVIDQGIAKDVDGSDHWPVWVDLELH